MDILPAAVLALTMSLDSATVGFLYGTRGIRLTRAGLAVVGLTSGLVLAAAVLLGRATAGLLGPGPARWGGATLLVAAGCWILLQSRRQAETLHRAGAGRPPAAVQRPEAPPAATALARRPLLRVIGRVFREPVAADLDASGSLSAAEALLLGLVLAVDSVAVGLGAGLAGLPPALLVGLTGLTGWLFLLAGWRVGSVLPWRLPRRWRFMHGALLVLIGLARLL